MSFTESLPSIYSKDWRKAERPTEDEAPRYSTYEAPGGKPLAFVQDDFDFSGGQSNETAEYPFDGLWSNTRLNKTPHKLTINGHLLGKTYIEERENFLNALLVPTDDNNPGYLDLPFWGRFPVVVSEYSVSEKTNEKGQCSLRLVFIRAGITLEVRSESLVNTTIPTSLAAEKVQAAAIDDFANKMNGDISLTALFAASGQIKVAMLSMLGRMQAPANMLNQIANEIYGIASIAADIINAPRTMALATTTAVNTIAAGFAEINNAVKNSNRKSVLLMFLNASSWNVDTIPKTVNEQYQKEATENLYRAAALSASAQVLSSFEELNYSDAHGYWRLYEKLEHSIDQNDPALFNAMQDMKSALSHELIQKELSAEKQRYLSSPLPLLAASHFLGCDNDKVRSLNQVEDSFLVSGTVTYV